MDPIIIAIAVGLGVPFFLLYERKKAWFIPSRIYALNTFIFLIGIILGFYFQTDQYYFFTWCFSLPIVIFLLDRLFKKYSEKKHGRDFILWLRYSDEINWSIGGVNPHVKTSDKILSVGLLSILVGLLGLGATLFGK